VFTNEARRGWNFPQAFGAGLRARDNPILKEANARANFLRGDD